MYKKKIVGYHGTTRKNAEKIEKEQHFEESSRNSDWLGQGVYFFAYKAHADWWTTHSRYAEIETRILSANLEYTEEEMLDLDDPESLKILDEIVKAAIAISNMSTNPTGAILDTKQKKWCFACNLIRNLHSEIGIIVHTFRDSKERVYKNCEFYGNQRQICVSRPSIIKEIMIV